MLQSVAVQRNSYYKVRTDQPHSKEVSEMEAAHISPELPIRWVVSADRTVEIKEEVTELGCDQANERILQEETPPSSITERGIGMKLVRLGRREESEMASSHIKVETPELEPVLIKEESPVLESVHIKDSVILNRQQQTGTGKTPYNCHECGADFRHHSTVKHHLRVLKVQLGYPCERQDSEMEPVHIKEELPELDPVHVKEELPELEPVHITEETPALEPVQINEESPEVESAEREHLSDEGEHDSTPSPRCKNSSSVKPQCRKHRETTPQEEHLKTLRLLKSTETAHSVCVNNSETRGNLKTLSCSTEDGKSSWQLGCRKTYKRNCTGGTPFPCTYCGKFFRYLSKLKSHQLIHTGEKPYHCNACEKSFNQLQNLKTHQRIHTGEKPYHCNECEKSFNQLQNLKKHQQIHTGEKRYHCNECEKSFNQLQNLKSHHRIHTGEKPYHCNECEKSFNQLQNLKKHQRIHRGPLK
ncbi:zinc finger protein 28-like isoform X11 [Acipenser ruthenus]|uniref:zinc finger protein 28-like isoform X11 n=1 Tax=Acipenser ruthenus TaxID=7906 RepID=UPI0027426C59|nr:zinc finger protein 28-like isoform X11 [Acipenser ruthenus]